MHLFTFASHQERLRTASPRLQNRDQFENPVSRSFDGVLRIARTLRSAAIQALKGMERIRRQPGGQRRMKLVESLALGGRRQLFLVVCNEQQYLVGASSDSVGSIVAMPSSAKGSELVRPRASLTHKEPGSRSIHSVSETSYQAWQ